MSPLCGSLRTGPASRVLYLDSTSYPDAVLQTSGFRAELSRAFSVAHLLSLHAIVYSYFSKESFWSFHDCQRYDQAEKLYQRLRAPLTPFSDLTSSYHDVYRGWEVRRKSKRYTVYLLISFIRNFLLKHLSIRQYKRLMTTCVDLIFIKNIESLSLLAK